jgi:hypothetical protein
MTQPRSTIMLMVQLVSSFWVVLLLSLVPSPGVWAITKTNCADFPTIVAGAALAESCMTFCDPDPGNSSDYNSGPTDTSSIVFRHISCHCTAPDFADQWRCTQKYPVWDTSLNYTETCEEQNITSDTQCQTFCKQINPMAFSSATKDGKATFCNCGPGVDICGTSGGGGVGRSSSKMTLTQWLVLLALMTTGWMVV